MVMKKKKLFKNKTQMIIYLILYIVCIGLFVFIGNINYKDSSETESKKFSNIYHDVPDENLYVFASATDVLNIVNGRSGVVLLGFPKNKWTKYTAVYLNEVAMEMGIDKIYYYDFLADRDESNGTYETIVNKLNVYTSVSDEGKTDLNAPTVLIVKEGEVIAYFDETAIIKGNTTPEDYYTENAIALTKNMFKKALEDYIK